VAHLSRLARQGAELVEEEDSVSTFTDRFQRIFQGLAEEIREARRAIRENHHLREENRKLREALSDCVEACGRYLAPMLEDRSSDPEQDDHARARDAIERGRGLLEDSRLRLLGP
jgi:regulator of replication initiation timing